MNERSGRIFYGWVIVFAATVISGMTMAMAGFNFGFFIKPMGDDLGISRQTFGWAISIRQVAAASTMFWAGSLIDRRGARSTLLFAAVATCVCMVGLSYTEDGFQLLVLFVVMGALGMVGPGALAVSVPVAKWFVIKRGKAMAFWAVGTPVGAIIFVPVTQQLIEAFGWRDAWLILAAVSFAVVVPLALLVRRQPEDMGLLPDGLNAGQRAATIDHPAHSEASWTVREAIRNVAFWRLVAVFSLVQLGMSSVGLHRIPHFTDQGISPRLVSFATSSDAAGAALSTFAMGMLIQRFPSRYVGAAGFSVLGLAVFLTIVADNVPMMFVAMITFGLGAGGMILLQNFLWAAYFGRAHVGAIRGAALPMTLVFSAAGPPVAGAVQDATGSYNPVWWVGMALMFTGALILFLTPPPRKDEQPAERVPATALPATGG